MKLRDLILCVIVSILMAATSMAQCPGGPTVTIDPDDPNDPAADVGCVLDDGRWVI